VTIKNKTNHSDMELLAIEKMKRGDVSGLEWIVYQYQSKALQISFFITHDFDLAQDVVQESFLNVYYGIRFFDLSRPFEPWFTRSVVNLSLKKMKLSKRTVSVDQTEIERNIHLIDTIDKYSLEEDVEEKDLRNKLWEALSSLPPQQRAVIVYRYYEGMSEKEISSLLGIAIGTVKWHLNMARNSLHSFFAKRRTHEE